MPNGRIDILFQIYCPQFLAEFLAIHGRNDSFGEQEIARRTQPFIAVVTD